MLVLRDHPDATFTMRLARRLTVAGVFLAVAIGGFVARLDRPPRPGPTDLPPEKQAIIDREEAMIVEGREHPASPSPYQWARPSPPAFEEGLWTRAQVGELPPSAGIDYVNVWTHILDRKYVSVFAGSRPDRPSDGLLFVEEIDPITWHHNFGSPDASVGPSGRFPSG